MHHGAVLLEIVIIVVLGIFSQWIAWRTKLPAIILLCLSGLIAGPGLGIISPSEQLGPLSGIIIKLAVAFILFDGGLNLRQYELKKAGSFVKRLIFLALPISLGLGFVISHHYGGLSVQTAMVLASILVVTGPTVIMPLIRHARLPSKLSSILKWEGILNDPIGALLAVLAFEFFITQGSGVESASEFGWQTILYSLLKGVVVATSLGVGIGLAIKIIFNKHWVPEFLKIPVIFCAIFVSYGWSNLVQAEAGLLAVTILGYLIGNADLRIIDDLRRFKEQIAVFLVSSVFVILTADLDMNILTRLEWTHLLLILSFLFIVRPIAVFLATLGLDVSWRERLLVGWIAPRGIVAASIAGLFAPAMVRAGIEDAILLIPLVFGVVFTTILCHGLSLHLLARTLGLSSSRSKSSVLIVGASKFAVELGKEISRRGLGVMIFDNSWYRLQQARLQGLPTRYGEILSDDAEEDVEFGNFTHLLALTLNDSYNSFVCNIFAHSLGPNNVLQLKFHSSGTESIGAKKKGQTFMSHPMKYGELATLMEDGWIFQTTPITDEFTQENALEGNSIPIAVIRKNESIEFFSSNVSPKAGAGDAVLRLSPPNR